jgi:GLPGLI family protein
VIPLAPAQMKYLEIDYYQTSKNEEGSEVTTMATLRDNGLFSLFEPRDTIISAEGNLRIAPNKSTKKSMRGVFTDRTTNTTTLYAPIFNKDFFIKEVGLVDSLQWTIVDSAQKVIANYTCKLATCTFRGREYEAYFTEEIPFFTGPWKLSGLPGAILEVTTVDGFFEFKAQQIRLSYRETPIDNPYAHVKGPFLSFQEHQKLFRKTFQDFVRKMNSEKKEEGVEVKLNISTLEM